MMIVLTTLWVVACGGGGGSAGTTTGSSSPLNFRVNAPAALTLAMAQKVSYTISGGTAPYRVSVSDPNVVSAVINGSTLEITTVRIGASTVTVATSDVVSQSVSVVPAYAIAVTVSASASSLQVQAPSGDVTLATGVTTSYTVSGGTPLYSALTNNPNVVTAQIVGSNVLSVTALRPGVGIVSVIDSVGSRVDKNITVVTATPLTTNAPATIKLARGAMVTYSASGGIAPYSVTAPEDATVLDVSLVGNTLSLIGKKAGIVTLRLRDSGGSEFLMTVTVVSAAFGLESGSFVRVAQGSTNTFNIVGGRSPYTAASQAPAVVTASVTGSTLSLAVAPAGAVIFPTDVVVRLTDADGTVADVTVNFSTVPAGVDLYTTAGTSVAIPVGTTSSYTVGGGKPPYVVSSSNTAVATAVVSNGQLSITGVGAGTANVILRDAAGTALPTIAVQVGSAGMFTTAGTNVAVAVGGSSSFTVGGGRTPYVVSSSNTAVATASVTAGQLTITGVATGTATVIVGDAAGALLPSITVQVGTAGMFTTAGTSVVVSAGSSSSFAVGGGRLPYTVSSSNTSVATASVTTGQLTITGIATGTATVIVSDALGTLLPGIAVRVGPTGSLFTTAPGNVGMQGSSSRIFTVGGGSPPYQVASSDTSIATANITGNVLTITSQSNGVAVVKVTDSAGAAASDISVTVTQAAGAAASSVDLTTNLAQIRSAGEEAVITAVVKNAGNVGMTNQSVTFTSSSGLLLSPSAATDASGVATVRLSAGSDKTNRSIVVTATVGSVTKTISVDVIGTQLIITGSTARQLSTPANTQTYSISAKDSGGAPIVGAVLTVTSSLSNALSTSSVTTSSSGTATFTHTATIAGAGTDVLTVTGLGTSGTLNVSISPIDFTVITPVTPVAPATFTSVNIGSTQEVRVRFRENNAPGTGNITFSTTRGTLSAAPGFALGVGGSVAVDVNGEAAVLVSSTSAGPATVTAQVPPASGTQPRAQVTAPLQFVAITPATVVVQANPGAIAPNASGAIGSYSDIEATVRDINANPVANQQVSFVITTDPSNGSLQSGVGVTDSNGKVQTKFFAGPNSTPNNGVTVRASVVSNPAVTNTVNLTVNGNALFINIGFGNTIANADPTTYSKPFSVYVTDANGNAVGNQSVTITVIPDPVGNAAYYKGRLSYNGTVWTYAVGSPTVSCANEDLNLNGVLDAGEDTNIDGRLTPGNIAVASPGAVVTDASGRATFNLLYGEQFAPWSTVQITARATVAGTESRRAINFALSGLDTDFSVETNPPAGVVSPFGVSALCTNSN